MTPVKLEPAAARSRVKHSTTESLRSPFENGTMANNAGPDQTPQYVASDLVLHCLLREFPFSNLNEFVTYYPIAMDQPMR